MKKRRLERVFALAAAMLLCGMLLAGCGQQNTGVQLADGPETANVNAGTDPNDVNTANAGEAAERGEDAANALNTARAGADAEADDQSDGTGTKTTYTAADYEAAGVNELNSVPILMYHRIYDLTNAETDYTGGNVDADGYNRTAEAFANDLENYYQMGYRMMRLTDYVDGNIDVAFGYSPIILTFDDGIRDVVIEGFDDDGNPIFDPSCAIGILEQYRQKYPDYNVTATFFVNNFLFEENQEESPRIMKWMVENGYDIGNHTWDHALLGDCDADEIEYQVGSMYQKLESILPGQYVNIVALPYGSPASMEGDSKYDRIFSGTYDGFSYTSRAALLCAWTRAYSPFTTEWDVTCIRRIRGYDNNGEDFDIEFNFEQLNAGRRYISDGDPDTIVIRADEEEGWLGETYGKEVIRY